MKTKLPINKQIIKKKLSATAIHFICSLLVFTVTVIWIKWIWYPAFHFELNGGIHGLKIMAGVDLVLGPLLTLLVFHPMKAAKERLTDFLFIVAVQICALSYGLFTMYQEHPKILSFYQYGTAVTVTQREWADIIQFNLTESEGNPITLPTTEQINNAVKIGNIPMFSYNRQGLKQTYGSISLDLLNVSDKNARRDMTYSDDKARLVEIEKQYGKVWVFALLGKYQGVFIAVNEKMEVLDTFGQRDLQ